MNWRDEERTRRDEHFVHELTPYSPLCRKWLLFDTCSYVLKFIYEAPLTKKHDTEKRERVNKH